MYYLKCNKNFSIVSQSDFDGLLIKTRSNFLDYNFFRFLFKKYF